ncbi:ubiquitin-conjugating enzyme E2 36-like [Arabidopsis lyrata subsp. lyrata]|uniref:ubiquitin-conjugating enzyme E2 36-like n=1 Tax=Arabidopsis lyrata subsp. lyrata TaxID=81972 RepID=UPI000A29AD39|nr:ubiquitin-conjugating enzyme E2 36-like [Arabidopsis lyrata subsp. lyrata]|eukprot:XP_020888792.1 ubiquitin-conjugating enzyme E2 36-like [Arabidopsis lyrata subsp. lyrata]
MSSMVMKMMGMFHMYLLVTELWRICGILSLQRWLKERDFHINSSRYFNVMILGPTQSPYEGVGFESRSKYLFGKVSI